MQGRGEGRMRGLALRNKGCLERGEGKERGGGHGNIGEETREGGLVGRKLRGKKRREGL